MDTAILSASAGLIGSLIGGVSTLAASWVTQHLQTGIEQVGFFFLFRTLRV
jgi:hypothetical protein